jgi:hypothetical protein
MTELADEMSAGAVIPSLNKPDAADRISGGIVASPAAAELAEEIMPDPIVSSKAVGPEFGTLTRVSRVAVNANVAVPGNSVSWTRAEAVKTSESLKTMDETGVDEAFTPSDSSNTELAMRAGVSANATVAANSVSLAGEETPKASDSSR